MKGVGEGGRMLGQLRCGFEFLTSNFMVSHSHSTCIIFQICPSFQEYCQNYIKYIVREDESTLSFCGTDANTPSQYTAKVWQMEKYNAYIVK